MSPSQSLTAEWARDGIHPSDIPDPIVCPCLARAAGRAHIEAAPSPGCRGL